MLQPIKKSFEPFSNADSTVLILGSLPGDKSLELSEYYAHPRNRFWKVIVTITASESPATFADKQHLLLSNTIALWDVAHSAQRKGSLDSAIENVVPNDIDAFIAQHKKIEDHRFQRVKITGTLRQIFREKQRHSLSGIAQHQPGKCRYQL